MPVKCKICNAEFPKLISSTHLKTHNISSLGYKAQFGAKSLASDEYRQQRSANNLGENNPNYGNVMSDIAKESISCKNSGKIPWNKGITLEDTSTQQLASVKRELKYASGELQRYIPVPTPATKEKISDSVRAYAKTNPDEMMLRATKAVKTKIENNYYIVKREKTKDAFIEKCNTLGFLTTILQDRIAELTCNTCGISHTRSTDSAIHERMCPSCNNVGHSSYKTELYAFLRELLPDGKILSSDRSVLTTLELDIYLPDLNLAIEVNGLYWHAEETGKGKFYHKYKTDKCAEKGIQLIHIFEDEWVYKKDICKNRIRAKLGQSRKIYARKCKIQSIEWGIAKEFLTENHIQGQGAGTPVVSAGLYYDTVLVAVMTFTRLSIAKGGKNTVGVYELNRYASIGNVVGGASRLFKFCVSATMPVSVITYADLRWNSGKLYSTLGFELQGVTTPGYWYVMGDKRIHRFKLRKGAEDSPDITEETLRRSQGYKRIWDCGNSKWAWSP